MTKSNLLCDNCPCGLSEFPTSSCPVALRTIDAIRNGASEDDPGLCPWTSPDKDSNHCFWLLLDREAPVEDCKIIGQLLGYSKTDTEKLLVSAITKLEAMRETHPKAVAEFADTIENCLTPLDDSIYLGLLDPNMPAAEDECQLDLYGDFQNRDIYTADGVEPSMDEGADKPLPKKPKNEALRYKTRGVSGAGALHHSGKIQLYSLSKNWGKQCKEWSEAGTPIVMAKYNLEHVTAEEEKAKRNAKKKNN